MKIEIRIRVDFTQIQLSRLLRSRFVQVTFKRADSKPIVRGKQAGRFAQVTLKVRSRFVEGTFKIRGRYEVATGKLRGRFGRF